MSETKHKIFTGEFKAKVAFEAIRKKAWGQVLKAWGQVFTLALYQRGRILTIDK